MVFNHRTQGRTGQHHEWFISINGSPHATQWHPLFPFDTFSSLPCRVTVGLLGISFRLQVAQSGPQGWPRCHSPAKIHSHRYAWVFSYRFAMLEWRVMAGKQLRIISSLASKIFFILLKNCLNTDSRTLNSFLIPWTQSKFTFFYIYHIFFLWCLWPWRVKMTE